jgi:hypothetical protein
MGGSDDDCECNKKKALEKLSPEQVRLTDLGGEEIEVLIPHAPGNGAIHRCSYQKGITDI